MTLTKLKIAEAIQTETGVPRPQAAVITETILRVAKDALASGKDILISGFGKFQLNQKAARKGRNPATRGKMMPGSRTVVTFKPSGKLRKGNLFLK